MKRKVKTTVRKKPNKNQQEKQTKKETPSMKRQKFKYGEQKSQTAKSERKLDLRRGCEETYFKERRTVRRKERGKKDRAKKQNENMWSHKGLMKAKKDMESSKGTQKKKKRQQKTRNREGLWKKALGGNKEQTNLSYIAGHSCCVSQIIRPVIKKHQNCRKNGVNCHNLKAKHQTQEKTNEKEKRKKQHKWKHKNNEDINNRKTRRSQMKGTWVSKGDVREMCWNDSSQNEER